MGEIPTEVCEKIMMFFFLTLWVKWLFFHLLVSGMCNPKNYSDSPATSKSTVEELHRPIPSLFRALTEGDAPINMMVVSFPVAEELSHHENLVSFLESLDNQHQNVSVPGNSIHASYDTQGNASFLLSHFGSQKIDEKHLFTLLMTFSFPY